MPSRFWVGGAGTWDASSTTHWALLSGGASGAAAPTTLDDAIFDSNSGLPAAVTVAATAVCLNWTVNGPASKTQAFSLAGNLTMTGLFTCLGGSTALASVNRVLIQSNVVGTQRTITAATISLANCDFEDIAAAGAASPFTGTQLGDCQGNSNITFDASTTQTWQGTTGGNWDTLAKWTSRVPLPQDDVVIASAFSASQTITANMPRLGRSIDFTGSTGSVAWSITSFASLFGDLTLAAGLGAWTLNSLVFAGRGAQKITSNGITTATTNGITVTAPGGVYTLQDGFSASGSNVIVSAGRLDTNSKTAEVATLVASGVLSGLTLGSTTLGINSTSAATVFNATGGGTFSLASSTIILRAASANTRTFAGGGRTYGTLTYTVAGSTGALVITGANTFGTVNFSDVTNARTLTLPASTTTTITVLFNVIGLASKLMTINSSSSGTAATLSKASGTVLCDYLSIKDSTATGGAQWFAGDHSTSVSGNTGWIFATALSAAASDSVVVTDALSSAYAQTRSSSDSAAVTDLAARGVLLGRSSADSAVVTVSVSTAGASSRAGSDSATITDIVAAISARLRSGSDSAIVTDAATRVGTRARAMADTVIVTEQASRSAPVSRSTADTTVVTDSVVRNGQTSSRTSADSVSVSDLATRGVLSTRSYAESVVITDVSGRSVAGSRSGAESVVVSDAVTRTAGVGRGAADGAIVSDGAAEMSGFVRAVADSTATTDSAGLGLRVSDSAAVSDAASRFDGTGRTVTDAVIVVESAGRTRSTQSSVRIPGQIDRLAIAGNVDQILIPG